MPDVGGGGGLALEEIANRDEAEPQLVGADFPWFTKPRSVMPT